MNGGGGGFLGFNDTSRLAGPSILVSTASPSCEKVRKSLVNINPQVEYMTKGLI